MATSGRPPSRVVFALIGGPLTALLIIITALTITGTLARQSESSPLSFATPVTTVRIDVNVGSITLRGSGEPTVTGERIVTRGLQTPTFSERVDGDTLFIDSTCNPLANTWCDVSYVLDIPRDVVVFADAALGSVRASDLTGAAQLTSATGSVHVENASGRLRLESGAGSVEASGVSSPEVIVTSGAGSVRLAFTVPPSYVEASVGAGSTDIELPRGDTTYRVEETSGDDQSIRIAVTTDPRSPNVVRVESGAGRVSVHYPEA